MASLGPTYADLMVINGYIATLDTPGSFVEAAAIHDGKFIAVGENAQMSGHRGPHTQVVDLGGRTVIPGLNDSHLHVIRGGLNYNMELRWDGVPSLADGLRMLKEQAERTPPGQWVRVVGGWSEFQFAERRMPTLEEINAAAPDTPVFVLHLYCRALLNNAALRACGYTKDTPNPPGGEIQRDSKGNPTGLLIARPNATILYATLAKGPKLPPEHQMNSTRHFMRELNRLGLTSVNDAGETKAIQFTHEVARGIHLVLRRELRPFGKRGVEDRRIRPRDEQAGGIAFTVALDFAAGWIRTVLCIAASSQGGPIEQRTAIQMQ